MFRYENQGNGVTVGNVVGNGSLRSFNFDTVMKPENLPTIRAVLERADVLHALGPESVPVADPGNQGGAVLTKGGTFVGFLPNNNQRTYQIEFTSATEYKLRYKEAGGQWSENWDPHVGRIDQDEVFVNAEKKVYGFILRHWWDTTQGDPQNHDKFTFDVNPAATLIEMPVLFKSLGGGAHAAAFTMNHVNSLVDGATVFTATSHGPRVDYDGSGLLKSILDDYVYGLFVRAGHDADKVITTDAIVYHNSGGSIHCGVNVKRAIPDVRWWEL